MKPRSLPRLFLCSVFATLWAAAPLRAGDKIDVAKVKSMFTAAAYIDHVRYLASDELGGRGTGQEGNDRATEYIADIFKAAGCKPAGVDGTYFQPFEVPSGKKITDEKTSLEISGMEQAWKLRTDWIPMPFTKAEDVEGPLAFAGYGIEAPDHNYNDYADFDAEGKVLLVLRYEPKAEDEKAEFGGKEPSRHSQFSTKASVAAKKKAKALLVVNPYKEGSTDDALYPFDSFSSRETYDIAMVHVKREVAEELLKKAGMPDLKTLQKKLETERKTLSADMKGLTANIKVGVEANALKTRNVVGLLEGDGSTDEVIVIGAHHDHLGTTRPWGGGSDAAAKIHNGADDNASGTSGVLEMVRACGHGPKMRRNILFMTYSGEEMGLLGSKHFVDHPTIDLGRVKAMINMDMIGRLNQDKLEICGATTAVEFEDIIKRAAEAVDLKYKAPKNIPGNSDHYSFHRKKIPVIFPFTGLHKQYHQPEDDWELIDSEGAAKILQAMYLVTYEVANMETGPTPPKEEEKAAKGDEKKADAKADEKKDQDTAQARPRQRAFMGIMPDYTDEKTGVRLQGVVEGRAAEKAGLKEGDRILKIGEHEIKTVEGYMEAMRNFKPNDVADLLVERDGKQMTVKITFEAAPQRGSRRD